MSHSRFIDLLLGCANVFVVLGALEMCNRIITWNLACYLVDTAPYWCAKNAVLTALNACMNLPNQINVNDLIVQTNSFASSGEIDSTENMRSHRVFILTGTEDSTVVQGLKLSQSVKLSQTPPHNSIMQLLLTSEAVVVLTALVLSLTVYHRHVSYVVQDMCSWTVSMDWQSCWSIQSSSARNIAMLWPVLLLWSDCACDLCNQNPIRIENSCANDVNWPTSAI